MTRKKSVIRKSIRIAGRPVTMRFSTKAQADNWYAQMKIKKENARAGVEMPIEPMLIEVAAANLLVDKQDQDNFAHDKFRLENYIISPLLGRHIHTITRAEWKNIFRMLADGGEWKDLFNGLEIPEKLRNKPRKPLAPKTINNIRTLVNLIYKEAMRNDPPNARKNPISDIPAMKCSRREMPHWKATEEVEAYLRSAAAEHTSFWIFAMIALNTGMREGEIIALKWRDIDFKSGTIFIWQTWDTRKRIIKPYTKTKEERTVGVNLALKNALLLHRARTAFKHNEDYVVYRWKTGKVTDSKTLWEIHDRVIKNAGIKYINPHGLRHTFATQYLAAGGNLYNLKNILGHKSITMTEKYAHLVTNKIRVNAEVFQVSAGGTADDAMMTTNGIQEVSYELH